MADRPSKTAPFFIKFTKVGRRSPTAAAMLTVNPVGLGTRSPVVESTDTNGVRVRVKEN